MSDSPIEHSSPFVQFKSILSADRTDLFVLLIYTIVNGILALAVPLAAQALVNTIAAGFFVQPLVVLTLIVLGGLIFSGAIRLIQLSIVEVIQQRIFARVALNLANHIPRMKQSAIQNEYAPELVNRFFDVLTIQKTFAKLLLDGIAAVLQVLVGLALMAFYSPFLLAFDFFLILFVIFIIWVLGIGGLRTSIQESVQKYSVASWLEEIARCQVSFKMDGAISYFIKKTDSLVAKYMRARRSHFKVTVRQATGSYLFQAVASAGILAIGGILVINRQLTLGQLVAAELIVTSVLFAIEKLIKQLEDMYDLLTGIDKISHLALLPKEREDGKILVENKLGVVVNCKNVYFKYLDNIPVLSGVDLYLSSGDKVSLVGASGAGKTTLAWLLCGLQESNQGIVEINGMDIRTVNLESLRRIVALVEDTKSIFEGTIEDNILLGRENITSDDINWALKLVNLNEDITRIPNGLKSLVVSDGRNLSRGQIQRILFARAIVDHPKLLILDEAFTGIDERTKLYILDQLYSNEYNWTILDISHDAEVISRSNIIYVLSNGKIVESGTIEKLAHTSKSEFSGLFPDLTYQVMQRNKN